MGLKIKILETGIVQPGEIKMFSTTTENNTFSVTPNCGEGKLNFKTTCKKDKGIACSDSQPFNGIHITDWQAGGKFENQVVNIENVSEEEIKVILSEVIYYVF